MEKPFPAYTGNEPYVFVCYAHADSEITYPEMEWLHQQGINLWYDEGISAGKNWRAAIGDSLFGASHVLFYISSSSLKSEHCNREINLALDKDIQVVPIYLEEVELTSDLMVGLNRVQALHRDLDGSYQQHLLNALGQSTSGVESREIIKSEESIQGFQSRRNTRLNIGKGTARKLAYAAFALVLLVAGFQLSDRFLSGNAGLANRSAIELAESQSGPVTRTTINLGLNDRFPMSRLRTEIAISPDGSKLAYTAFREGKIQLYLRELSELEPRIIAEIIDSLAGSSPSFSSDGDWLLHHDGLNLTKTRLANGVAQIIGLGSHGVFSDTDQNILYVSESGTLFHQPATGGTGESLGLANSEGEMFTYPKVLPGGAILFTASPETGVSNGAQIHLLDPQTGNTSLLIQEGYNARYAASGHIVYIYQGGIWAIPFDIDKLEVTGAPAPIVQEVATSSYAGQSVYAFSDEGRLVYLPGVDTFVGEKSSFVWVDKDGNEEPLGLEPQRYAYPSVAPDGEKLAFMIRQADNTRDIWTYELSSGAFNRLTFSGTARFQVWSPNGESLAYNDNMQNISLIQVDGTGLPRVVSAESNQDLPWSFTPDGSQIIGWQPLEWDTINTHSLGDKAEVQTLIDEDFGVRGGRVSPNGRWIAYTSLEAGLREIYVRPFPNTDGGRWQVSINGGLEAIWGPNGQELYYRRLSDNAMLAVTVETGSNFNAGNPRVLFTGDYFVGFFPTYDLHPDGLRFLMLKTEEISTSNLPTEFTSLVVVENWFEELKRLAPPDPQ